LYIVTDLSAGDKLTKPEDPVKDGYTFAGWHKDSACTQAWDFNDGITGDMTLYAKWTAQATATPTVTPTATATVTPTVTATATTTATPTGDASPAQTSQPDNEGSNGDTTATSGISLPYLIGGILILLLAILLLLFLLLRHTVTFLIPTGGELEEYRIKVWHGKYIDPGQLPELLRTAAWYRDPARQERWDFNEDRVTKSIELYLG
ncbi:MAG TPA: InlB B-repeat-containing protein, partial [Methanocorpusculum sp.]|nr:InlB B-repeat-containing protein [Methanocorpusculum sp.]